MSGHDMHQGPVRQTAGACITYRVAIFEIQQWKERPPPTQIAREDCLEILDWQNWEKTEPPLTLGISDEALKQMVVRGVPAKRV
ncbi:hypothetical protein AVEN_267882-1 [Araneus ventricosus]|uniref:Uncharacterized protein n=1 Tax=Araneus ventricosus TaxID=182803 RepID=A0A4Y2HAW5_ARAVE|nr:hypothetical protein AVEN_267882-1 [Araneus ventricosus]